MYLVELIGLLVALFVQCEEPHASLFRIGTLSNYHIPRPHRDDSLPIEGLFDCSGQANVIPN